jgi:hypothetical protein
VKLGQAAEHHKGSTFSFLMKWRQSFPGMPSDVETIGLDGYDLRIYVYSSCNRRWGRQSPIVANNRGELALRHKDVLPTNIWQEPHQEV